jgi:hypothetical protein
MLVKNKTLYETDFNQWIEETVRQLKNKDFQTIDLENLIEEITDLGRNQKHAVESLLIKLFEHLLKLTYWESEREYNQKHWKREIRTFRDSLDRSIKDSPSLKPYLVSVFNDCYQTGRKLAADSTGFPLSTFPLEPIGTSIISFKSVLVSLPLSTFPLEPIGTPEQILDENWFPNY